MGTSIRITWRESPPMLGQADCLWCHGTGWQLVPGAGPGHARRCQCRALHAVSTMKQSVGIPAELERCSLRNFVPRNLSQARALAAARRFVSRYPAVESSLVLSGAEGTGKTHVAVGIVRELVTRLQQDIVFVDFQALLRMPPSVTGADRIRADWQRLNNVGLLVIDDFGRGMPSPENVHRVEQVLLHRIGGRRHAVITTGRIRAADATARAGRSARQTGERFWAALNPSIVSAFLQRAKIVSLLDDSYRCQPDAPAPLFAS